MAPCLASGALVLLAASGWSLTVPRGSCISGLAPKMALLENFEHMSLFKSLAALLRNLGPGSLPLSLLLSGNEMSNLLFQASAATVI